MKSHPTWFPTKYDLIHYLSLIMEENLIFFILWNTK